MIISTLNKVLDEMNATRRKQGLKPIDSVNKLAKAMKRAKLPVSRPTLSKLLGLTPLHRAKNVDFKTLDKLCKFFKGSRVQDFIHFVGKPTNVRLMPFTDFLKDKTKAQLDSIDLNPKSVARCATAMLVTDEHEHGFTIPSHSKFTNIRKDKKGFTHMDEHRTPARKVINFKGMQKYLLIFVPRFIRTGIRKTYNTYTIQCTYIRCTSINNISTAWVQDALIDIFSNLSLQERKFIDTVIIRYYKPNDKYPLWRSMPKINVQDDFGITKINSASIAVPELAFDLSNDKNDSNYNFHFFTGMPKKSSK